MDLEKGLADIEDRVNGKLLKLIPDIHRVLDSFHIAREDTLNRFAQSRVQFKHLERDIAVQ